MTAIDGQLALGAAYDSFDATLAEQEGENFSKLGEVKDATINACHWAVAGAVTQGVCSVATAAANGSQAYDNAVAANPQLGDYNVPDTSTKAVV